MSETKVETRPPRVRVNADRRRPRVRRAWAHDQVRLRPVTVRSTTAR